MLKFRTILFSVVAMGILISLSAARTDAQGWGMVASDQKYYTNNPCANPYISWVLHNESNNPTGAADCNPANYGTWSTDAQLQANLRAYRYEQKMKTNGITLAGSFTGRDGNRYLVFKKGSAAIGINVGVVGTAGGSIVSHDGGTLVSTNGGNVIAQGGGNIVLSLATVIAQGGGNLIGNDSAGVVAQGGGNVIGGGQGAGRVGFDLGSGTLFQFPNRYAVVSGPPAKAPTPQTSKPTTPTSADWAPKVSDDSILLCVNSSSGLFRQLRANSANHISVRVSAGTAYFDGNVIVRPGQDDKGNLTLAARRCSAQDVKNNLRVGK